jgi:hypothetical protein
MGMGAIWIGEVPIVEPDGDFDFKARAESNLAESRYEKATSLISMETISI